MRYRVRHSTKYNYADAVPVCHNLVHLAPRTMSSQACLAFELNITPTPHEQALRTDAFGNRVDYFSIQDPHRMLDLVAISELEVLPRDSLDVASGSWETIAEEVRYIRSDVYLDAFQYVFPSKYVPLAGSLAEYARVSFQPGRELIAAATDLTQRIYDDFEYNPRATTISTPVVEVFQRRAGVCQDFAHLQIACLRSVGIPARYVSGYLRTVPPPGQARLVGANASHAWISIFCGQRGWVDFDPTNNVVPASDHMTIGWGRDYRDVCPVQGVLIGGGRHKLSISVDVEPI